MTAYYLNELGQFVGENYNLICDKKIYVNDTVYSPNVFFAYDEESEANLLCDAMSNMTNISDGINHDSYKYVCIYSNIKWLDDKVIYSFSFNYTGKNPNHYYNGTYHSYISYPRSILAKCLACGAVCSSEPQICKRCRPLIAEIVEEEKENRRIQKEVKELQRTIKQFEERLNERYRRHQNQVAGPLAEVRQGRTRRSRGENSHRIRKSNA